MSMPSAKALTQLRDLGDMGEDAQLDLRVVRRHEPMPRRRHEGGADAPALLGAHRDVLQVRLGRRQAPGGGRRERVRGVDALRLRMDEARQRIRIGRLELGELTPFEDARRQLVTLLGEVLEHLGTRRPGTGGSLGGAGKAHLAEQDVTELLGRAEVERPAGEFVDLGFEPRHALREFAREA
jgi:hypothetical protein